MVGSVAAGAVLIAGLNANAAVRSAQACPLACLLCFKPWPALFGLLIKQAALKRKG